MVSVCLLPLRASMMATYCWLKVLMVSSMAGLCVVTKLKATLSLDSVEEDEEACELLSRITRKESRNA